MPIYEYTCLDCDHRFETLVRSASTTPDCPACHGSHLQKLLSVFAVGARETQPACAPLGGPCGSCGDPRGPGACSMH